MKKGKESYSGVLARKPKGPKGHVPSLRMTFEGCETYKLIFNILFEVSIGASLRSEGTPFFLIMKVPTREYSPSTLLVSYTYYIHLRILLNTFQSSNCFCSM